jgi:GNAT superfamily N-acetyltransferase
VEVRRVRTEAEARQWSVAVRQGFGETNVDEEAAVATDAPVRASASNSWFLAWSDGKVAGGAALDVRDGVALLFAASTLPSARRQGAHRALMEARLAAAREAGADLAVVITEPGSDSQRNVERAGFQVAYTALVLHKPFVRQPSP